MLVTLLQLWYAPPPFLLFASRVFVLFSLCASCCLPLSGPGGGHSAQSSVIGIAVCHRSFLTCLKIIFCAKGMDIPAHALRLERFLLPITRRGKVSSPHVVSRCAETRRFVRSRKGFFGLVIFLFDAFLFGRASGNRTFSAWRDLSKATRCAEQFGTVRQSVGKRACTAVIQHDFGT